jgi:DNA-binding LacI/PurR family transcriptional regulator
LICSDAQDERAGADLLPGISEFAQLHHWQAEIHFVSPSASTLSHPAYANLSALKKRLWSGLLLVSLFPVQVVGELSARLPCVSLLERYERLPIECVDVNHHHGMAALMDRLRRHGHTRIGFFGRRDVLPSVALCRRSSAFMECLARDGAPYRERDMVQLDSTSPETIAAGYRRVVEQIRDGVTAWMCAADAQAWELIAHLQENGYHVPGDISITGFGGSPCPAGAPVLDTVRVPFYDIGFAGSRRLSEKIARRYDTPQEILLEGRLQEGETVGPCRVPAQ